MPTSTPIQGFIFDLDGTLVESALDFQWLRSETGCPSDEDLLSYVEGLNPHEQQRAQRIIEQHELDDAMSAAPLPGAMELLQQLRLHAVPTAIVTRNCRAAAQRKMSNNQLTVDRLLTREDAPPKPAPDGLLNIANGWGIAPQHCVYVGDYLYDVQAANNAGMLSCLFAPSALPEYSNQADIVTRELEQLLQAIREFYHTHTL